MLAKDNSSGFLFQMENTYSYFSIDSKYLRKIGFDMTFPFHENTLAQTNIKRNRNTISILLIKIMFTGLPIFFMFDNDDII